MSIRWVKNVIISGAKSSVEVQIGDRRIGDKCYTRIGGDLESWFDNSSDDREAIIEQGIALLKQRLEGKQIQNADGSPFDWR